MDTGQLEKDSQMDKDRVAIGVEVGGRIVCDSSATVTRMNGLVLGWCLKYVSCID